ncbi:carbohydrate kinase [Sphingobium quisquiliarum P25]|uniref:Carbohydrate kinase n=1 Tax=Sphingobium quisquiliarum P25 TaxID=1329909 RepID=T0IFY9_9SPHN|nr:PfkB family carbohydrate kinase [Sphingobium quisquiliarum]EQB08559.1 carbohydrate kinase [Sphingobium quisquiliarum P25]
MTAAPTLDVVAIGNAIVDVLAPSDDAFLAEHALTKGGMQLIDAATAESLYADMAAGKEVSGGSAANTLAGLAALGKKCGFIGQVCDDQLGAVFAHDVRALGIRYDTPAVKGDVPTARCLILVTPDAQRTMNTFLGASQFLPASALDMDLIRSASILYLEGYLWDPEQPRAAMRAAIDAARGAGRKVAFTLSDSFVIDRHRDDFIDLIDKGLIDILFSNEGEIQSLAQIDDFEKAVTAIAARVPVLVSTRSEKGAIALIDGVRYETLAAPVEAVVDTTGAGDLFAAGFLAGHLEGLDVETCLKLGAAAAAEVISHWGARPEQDLLAIRASVLG